MLQGATGRDGDYFLLSRLDASSVSNRRSPCLHIEMRSGTLRVDGGAGNRMLRLGRKKKGGEGDFVEGCRGTESNRRHGDFQSPALPTELPRLSKRVVFYQNP